MRRGFLDQPPSRAAVAKAKAQEALDRRRRVARGSIARAVPSLEGAPPVQGDGQVSAPPVAVGPMYVFRERVAVLANPREVSHWIADHGLPDLHEEPIASPTIPYGAPDPMMAATTSEQNRGTSGPEQDPAACSRCRSAACIGKCRLRTPEVVRWELLTMLVMDSDARLNPAHVAIGRARYRTAAERFYWVAVRAQCVEAAWRHED